MNYRNYPEIKQFEVGLSELGIELTELKLQQFVDYYEMLIEKNKVMNLTAITDFKEVISKHFLDSLSLVKVYQPMKERILDVGTGAGFPGIPLKIVFPEIKLVLLDSLNKRLIFLQEVIEELKLKDVITLHGRAEDYGKNIKYRETFDLCVSRAVAKLSFLSEYCLPFVKEGGYFIAYKSGNIAEELEQSERAFQILGGKLKNQENFNLPDTDIERSLIMIKKIRKTPSNYPGRAGKAKKEI